MALIRSLGLRGGGSSPPPPPTGIVEDFEDDTYTLTPVSLTPARPWERGAYGGRSGVLRATVGSPEQVFAGYVPFSLSSPCRLEFDWRRDGSSIRTALYRLEKLVTGTSTVERRFMLVRTETATAWTTWTSTYALEAGEYRLSLEHYSSSGAGAGEVLYLDDVRLIPHATLPPAGWLEDFATPPYEVALSGQWGIYSNRWESDTIYDDYGSVAGTLTLTVTGRALLRYDAYLDPGDSEATGDVVVLDALGNAVDAFAPPLPTLTVQTYEINLPGAGTYTLEGILTLGTVVGSSAAYAYVDNLRLDYAP